MGDTAKMLFPEDYKSCLVSSYKEQSFKNKKQNISFWFPY